METSRFGSSTLRSFVGVVGQRQTYRNLAYLLVTILLGWFYYVGLFVGLLMGVVLFIALVGVPMVLVTVIGSRYVAEFERRLANALLGTAFVTPSVPTIREDGALAALLGVLRAESTWKGIAFLFLKSLIGFLTGLCWLVFGMTALALTLAPLGGSVEIWELWTIDTHWESVLAVPLGISLAIATLHLSNGIANITGSLAGSLLDGAREGPPE